MKDNELLEIVGGFSISGTFINAITKAVTTLYDIAKRFGSAYQRAKTGNLCSL